MHLMMAALAGSLSLSALGACAGNQANGELVPANAVAVHVSNQNDRGMDVYLVNGGVATQLGTVLGHQSENFTIAPSMITPGLRITATPIGGDGRATTGPLDVTAGQTIDFRIGSILSASSVFIR